MPMQGQDNSTDNDIHRLILTKLRWKDSRNSDLIIRNSAIPSLSLSLFLERNYFRLFHSSIDGRKITPFSKIASHEDSNFLQTCRKQLLHGVGGGILMAFGVSANFSWLLRRSFEISFSTICRDFDVYIVAEILTYDRSYLRGLSDVIEKRLTS